MGDSPVLLYDGQCGFCQRTVQFVLRRDRRRTLQFAPLDGDLAATVRTRHPEIAGVDSVVWVDRAGDRVSLRSEAALAVARYLGAPWSWLGGFALVPRVVRDWVYDAIARRRHHLTPRRDCLVPTPEERARFLA